MSEDFTDGYIYVDYAHMDNAADDLRCTLVHARIPREQVRAFWAEVQALARKFAQIPRSGDQVYGFVAGLYPTDAPTLPDPTPTGPGPAD